VQIFRPKPVSYGFPTDVQQRAAETIDYLMERLPARPLTVKGAQTRSCSLSVLVMETAEQVASVHSAWVIVAQDGQLGRRIWPL